MSLWEEIRVEEARKARLEKELAELEDDLDKAKERLSSRLHATAMMDWRAMYEDFEGAVPAIFIAPDSDDHTVQSIRLACRKEGIEHVSIHKHLDPEPCRCLSSQGTGGGGPEYDALKNHTRPALRLDEILHELTRARPEEKDARPLATGYDLRSGNGEFMFEVFAPVGEDVSLLFVRQSSVEAAAAALLQLLRERRSRV